MQKEKIVALLENIEKCHAENGVVGYYNLMELHETVKQLYAEIAADNAKKPGKTDLFRACKNILKDAARDAGHNAGLQGVTTINGRSYVCDGHRIIRMQENAVNLPAVDLSKIAIPIDYEGLYKGFDIAGMQDAETLPDAATLASQIKLAKAKHKGERGVRYLYGIGGKTTVNAEFLLDAILATGAEKCRFTDSKKPVYMENAAGTVDAVVLPVYRTEPVQAGEIVAVA